MLPLWERPGSSYPPYRFKVVDHMITNFHLPKSTLLMLVAVVCGKGQYPELTKRQWHCDTASSHLRRDAYSLET